MAFRPLVEALDQACISTFQLTDDSGTPITVILHPQSGGPDIPLQVIEESPAFAEDYVPGSSQNVSVMRLFVRFVDISTPPQKGDTVSVNGVNYDLFEADVDREGGATLKIRRNG